MSEQNKHNDDRPLKQLFRAARQDDEAQAPDFDTVRRAAPPAATPWWLRVVPRPAALGLIGTMTIATAALWLGVFHPTDQLVVGNPIGSPVPVEKQIAPTETVTGGEPVPITGPDEFKNEIRSELTADDNRSPQPATPNPAHLEFIARQLEKAAPVPRPVQETVERKLKRREPSSSSSNVGDELAAMNQELESLGYVESSSHLVASSKFSANYTADLPVQDRVYQRTITLNPGIVIDADGDGNPNINAESYNRFEENRFQSPADTPLSTFSIDVDTASYSNVRRFLNQGRRPPADAVRIEEFITYFDYDYPEPTGNAPFSTTVEVASCPWNSDHRLARIGLRGRSVDRGDNAGSNLVFLIDVSGSMNSRDKLPLLKDGLGLLVDQLNARDSVAIVVYAGSSGLVLPPTPGSDNTRIRDALGRLNAGGSTNGGEGLRLAYRLARENFIPGGVNRVILATDGDFNVGVTGHSELIDIVKSDADRGIFMTALGFGGGNLHDDRLEELANRGNGHYAYIDSMAEARKVLVEEIGGTLVTIAKDVKIQVEFNPTQVAGYRLIGYENRALAARDFNNDTKDAGEIGAGHTVTALYEIVPAGLRVPGEPTVDPLRYVEDANKRLRPDDSRGQELFHLKLRYKRPEGHKSRLIEVPVLDNGRDMAAATADFKFASGVALFGMLLRGSEFSGDGTFRDVDRLAIEGRGRDHGEHRSEFRRLVAKASEQRD